MTVLQLEHHPPWYQTLVEKKRAKSPIRALDLLAKPRYGHHAYKHLKWEASERERVMLWVTEWGICNFRGPWHQATSPPGWDVPAQVVLAPKAPCWRETTGQTQSGLGVGIFPASSPHSSSPTVILTWLENGQTYLQSPLYNIFSSYSVLLNLCSWSCTK